MYIVTNPINVERSAKERENEVFYLNKSFCKNGKQHFNQSETIDNCLLHCSHYKCRPKTFS